MQVGTFIRQWWWWLWWWWRWLRRRRRQWSWRWRPMFSNLYDKVTASEVGNCAWQSRTAPHKAEEQRTLGVAEFLHDFPEPLNQRCRRINALVRRHRLEQIQWYIWTTTYLYKAHKHMHDYTVDILDKEKSLNTCYSAAYTSTVQQPFTISDVPADWHELWNHIFLQ